MSLRRCAALADSHALMGLFDTLLGRTKPVRANLDALFALPTAADHPAGDGGPRPDRPRRGVLQASRGQPFAEMQAELEQVLTTPDDSGTGAPATVGGTTHGPPGHAAPARRGAGHAHRAPRGRQVRLPLDHRGRERRRRPRHACPHGALLAPGRGVEHPAAVLGLRFRARARSGCDGVERHRRTRGHRHEGDAITRPLYIVYLAKQGTFYPFAPRGQEQRDSELELRVRSMLGRRPAHRARPVGGSPCGTSPSPDGRRARRADRRADRPPRPPPRPDRPAAVLTCPARPDAADRQRRGPAPA